MAVTIYDNFKYLQFTQSIDLMSDELKVALLNGYTPSSSHELFSEVSSFEASGSGYISGGKALSGKTLSAVTPITFDAANLDWQMSSITATGAVLYKTTGELIAYFPYSGTKISTDGEFFHEWSASGILQLA
jgi:hypothetical protein